VPIERHDPPARADESTQLRGFLDYQRATLRQKVDGLDAAQLNAVLPPSDMALSGMLKHLALNEDWWFSCVFAAAAGPDALSVRPDRSGDLFTLRWILVHMIEEYARHNGHADLIRQSIDGAVGE
jgi:hypothetical protein